MLSFLGFRIQGKSGNPIFIVLVGVWIYVCGTSQNIQFN